MTKRAVFLGWCTILAACAGAPLPLAEPLVELHATHVPPLGGGAPPMGTTARRVQIEVFALRTAPTGRSLDDATLAIVAASGAPFRAVSDLPPGCLWIDDASATAAVGGGPVDVERLGAITVAVVDGLEAVVATSLSTLPTLRITNANGACRLRIASPRLADHAGDDVLVRDPLADTRVLFVPAPSPRRAGYAFSIVSGGDADAASVADALAAAAAATPRAVNVGERQVEIANASLGEHRRRPALLALARAYELPRCTDLVLAADEAHLAAMTTGACTPPPTGPTAAWSFERAIVAATLPALQQDELPPALFAALVRHVGALALDATALQTCLEDARDSAAFDAAVREENEQALESRDPVRRVRAHEWLGAHAAAVPGYDPMADVATRRAALRQHAATVQR